MHSETSTTPGKDQYFRLPRSLITPFEFNQEVARVFDDMVQRSVPFYHEINRLICDLAPYFLRPGDTVYDLGCSTAQTLIVLDEHLQIKGLHYIGVDNSQPMILEAKTKAQKLGLRNVEFVCESLEQIKLQPSKFIILNYTLQFIPLENRPFILKKIFEALVPGGILIMAEKIKVQDPHIQSLQTELYYDFKRRNGYSELEISQKREALENVLVPLTPQEEVALLKRAGFSHIDTLFRWYNFACFIGIK